MEVIDADSTPLQLVKTGTVRYIGMSSCKTAEFLSMQYYAKSKGVREPARQGRLAPRSNRATSR